MKTNAFAIPRWKRNVALFTVGQIISLFGSMLVQYAISWYITFTTQSGLLVTVSIIIGFLPSLLLSPLSGVLADRMPRKWLMVLADGSIAIATLISALIFMFFNVDALWLLLIVSLVRAIGGAFHGPAVSSAFVELVPKQHLMRIQGIQTGLQSTLNLLAPMLAAFLLSIFPIQNILFIDVVTAATAIGLLMFFVVIPHQEKGKVTKENVASDFKAGIAYVKSHAFLPPFFVLLSLVLIFVSPLAFLTPLQVVRSFPDVSDDYLKLSVIEITWSVGMILGSAIVSAWGGFKNRMFTMGFAVVFMGLGTVVLGLAQNFIFYSILMTVMGISLPFVNVPSNVVLSEQVEPAFMGRVMSVNAMVSSLMFPIGIIVFGPLSDIVPIETILVVTGVLQFLIGFVYFLHPQLVKAGTPKIVKPQTAKR